MEREINKVNTVFQEERDCILNQFAIEVNTNQLIESIYMILKKNNLDEWFPIEILFSPNVSQFLD
jgi:hypothetical protein